MEEKVERLMAADETPTRRSLLDAATQQFEAADLEVPRTHAEWLLVDVLGCSRVDLHAYPERAVSLEDARQFASLVRRCIDGEPIQYVLGHHEFYGLELRVTPDVLIPRLETEEVVEAALELIADMHRPRVLDAGTGSGCMACAIQHERPDAEVHACDVSESALEVARENATRHDLDIQFFAADLLSEKFSDQAPGNVDLLISNPPYLLDSEADVLPDQVRDYEPETALFVGDDPLRFYRVLAQHAPRLLADDGVLVVETHADYGASVRTCWEQDDRLTDVQLQEDLGGRARIVTARLAES